MFCFPQAYEYNMTDVMWTGSKLFKSNTILCVNVFYIDRLIKKQSPLPLQ